MKEDEVGGTYSVHDREE